MSKIGPHKRSEEEVRKLYEEYKAGKTLREVGEQLGVTRQRILQIFRAYSLETRGQTQSDLTRRHFESVRRRHAESRKVIPRDVLVKLSRREIPLKTVLDDFQCSYSCIQWSRKVHGIEAQERRKNPELTDDLLRELVIERKMTTSQIADAYGYTKGSISIKLHRLGITRRRNTSR